MTALGLIHSHSSQDRMAAAAHLQSSLTDWIAGEQAKGVLTEKRGISIEAASDLIDHHTDHTHDQPDRAGKDTPPNDAKPKQIKALEPPALLTPAEVAAMFCVAPKTVTRWATTGQLTPVRTLGGHRRYWFAEVTALLLQQG